MSHPVAFRLVPQAAQVAVVDVDDSTAARLRRLAPASPATPAVIVTTGQRELSELGAVLIEEDQVVSVIDGSWERAIIVSLGPDASATGSSAVPDDSAFLEETASRAPRVLRLAQTTVDAIRAAGVEGHLASTGTNYRWVNRPLNVFTLTAQPRTGKIQFTLYGDPDSYQAGDFLRPDQHGYSRGWVCDADDAALLARLTSEARRRRR